MTKLGRLSLHTFNRFIDYFFRLSVSAQFLAWFLFILAIKFDTLLAPPVWDTAMGVFPPAIFLFENSFNLLELINQPGWWEGGPNVHSVSLWTWIIAIVMTITEDPTNTFFILHSFTFALNALAISLFVKTLHLMNIRAYLAILAGLTLLLAPVVLVQIGYMYTESLVMALSMLVWVTWHHQREGLAVLLVLIALSIKTTGLIIGLALLPVLFLRLIKQFSLKRLTLLVSIPLFYTFYNSLYGWLGGKDISRPWASKEIVLRHLFDRIERVPDISLLLGSGVLVAVCYVLYQWYRSGKINPIAPLTNYCVRDGSMAIVVCCLLAFCLGISYMTYQGQLFLYRYLAPMIPFALISLLIFSKALRMQSAMTGIFLALCIVFVYNHNGALYRHSSAFSIVENSHAYKPYVSAQRTMIDQISQLNNDTPIYVSREIDYMTSHPMMGYLDKTKPNIIGFYKDEYSDMLIEDFPSEYYVVRTNSGHGGPRLSWAIRKARDAVDKSWQITLVYQQNTDNRPMTIYHMYKPPD